MVNAILPYSQMAWDFRAGFTKCVFRDCVYYMYTCGLDMATMALAMLYSSMDGKMREFHYNCVLFSEHTHTQKHMILFKRNKKHMKI